MKIDRKLVEERKWIDRLISLLDKATDEAMLVRSSNCYADRALYLLLAEYRDVLPDIDDQFHPMFRKVDVTDRAKVDMAIWQMLHGSKLFWEVFNKLLEEREGTGG